MRLRLRLSGNQHPVPFDYQHQLIGALHKRLGQDNDLHDRLSLYSSSWLHGGHAAGDHLRFPRGAEWLVSFYDERLIEAFVDRTLADPELCYGMRVTEITQQPAPRFGTSHTFRTGSPVLARAPHPRDAPGQPRHLIYTDPEADDVLTEILRRKMDAAGLDPAHRATRVGFDRTYRAAKTKLVTIKNISNRASVCPVRLEGTPEGIAFAWTVGVGHSTGSGFGCLL